MNGKQVTYGLGKQVKNGFGLSGVVTINASIFIV
jgi:hypothetical protein